jgi:hypothetical protein
VKRGVVAGQEPLPADGALPALVAMERDGVAAVLSGIGLTPPFEGIAVLKHHPGRRCTFAVRAGGREVVAKAYRGGDVAAQVGLLDALDRAGLVGERGPKAPRVVAFDLDLRMLVVERLDGPCGTALIARGADAGRLAADWLLRQWAARIPLGPGYGADAFLARVERNCAPILAASPRLGVAAIERLAALRADTPPPGEVVLVHGSFSVAHIIDVGGGAGVIDWDGFAQGAREVDAGAFLGTLARMAARRPDLEAAAAGAAAAFRAAIAGEVDPAVLAWYEAGARLRCARHVCMRRPSGWEARAERLIAPLPAPSRLAA